MDIAAGQADGHRTDPLAGSMDDPSVIAARNPQLALAGDARLRGRLKSKAVIIPVVNGAVIHKGHDRPLAEAAYPFFLRHSG